MIMISKTLQLVSLETWQSCDYTNRELDGTTLNDIAVKADGRTFIAAGLHRNQGRGYNS